MSLADSPESSREGTTITHQGRWRKTKSQHQPIVPYQSAELPPVWSDVPIPYVLNGRISETTAMRQQFQYIFLTSHMPGEMLKSRREDIVPMSNWIITLQDEAIQSPALDISIAAFFAARIARKQGDEDLSYKSHAMYLVGLEEVQKAVNNPRTRFSDETLAACMALSLYELTERLGGAFITHLRGALTLLQLRGPAACTTPLGHGIFLWLRSQTVSHFVVSMKPELLLTAIEAHLKSPAESRDLLLSPRMARGAVEADPENSPR